MASMPARRPSQRRASPAEEQSQTPSSAQTPISPVRSRSEDSQTIFVHRSEEEEDDQQEQADFGPEPTQQQSGSNEDESLSKCWICYNDASETGPERGPWRSPCPCSLTAHEECLLDWIADMEANNRKGTRSITAPKIECPQCKSEIKIARPRDYLVDAVKMVERAGHKMITPATLTALAGILYGTFAWVGEHAIYEVFGARDGNRILQPAYRVVHIPSIGPHFLREGDLANFGSAVSELVLSRLAHWRLYIGVPLITPVLILSRTRYADGMIPVLPIVFFASQVHTAGDPLEFAQWPPSASFCFALLPYARSIYNFYWQKVWAEKEKQWLLEVQPKTTQEQADGNDAANLDPANPPADEENIFEVRIDHGIWDDWDNENQMDQAVAENDAINNLQAQQEDEAAPGPNVADNRPLPQGGANEQPNAARQPPQRPQQNANGERRLAISPTALAATALGAIVFPSIAGLSGDLLKLILPASWTTPAKSTAFWGRAAPRQFLQQKWARSLIGGCLFIVAKDAVMLYVRWKMAQMHRNRSIVDYNKNRGNSRRAAAS